MKRSVRDKRRRARKAPRTLAHEADALLSGSTNAIGRIRINADDFELFADGSSSRSPSSDPDAASIFLTVDGVPSLAEVTFDVDTKTVSIRAIRATYSTTKVET